jgi:dihydroneopterin aldolase
MDRVVLSGIRCRLRVGVTPEERRNPQDCLVDVELERDLIRPMQTDDLLDSIDYSRVLARVHGLAREEEFALLERFAGRLEEELRRDFRFDGLVLRVKKLRPPLPGSMDWAGIEVRRTGVS